MQNLLKINSKLPLLKKKGLKRFSEKYKRDRHKKNYRKIDFFRKNKIGIVTSIEYDSNRTSFVASVYNYFFKNYFYVIAPKKLTVGDIVKSGSNAAMKLAHSLKLSQLIEGTLVYNLSQNKTKKGEFSRSGGCFSVLIKKTANFSIVFLSSGKYCKFSNNCLASVGIVSNKQNSLKNLKKAGKSR